MFISILLPVRGEREELVDCLASIAAQTYARDRFEVLIADASEPPIDPALLPSGVAWRVVANPERIMSRGLNLVARQARGDRLAIVSAHSRLPPDYLERMAAVATETGAANVGVRVRKTGRSAWGRAIAAATSSPLGVGGGAQHHGRRPGPTDSAFPGFIDRRAFERLGGFDPRLACNEDDDFNARLRADDGLVWFEPDVEVDYRPRDTPDGVFRQYFRYGRWKVAVARAGVPGYLRPRHLAPSLAVIGAVVLGAATVIWRRAAIPAAVAGTVYGALATTEARRTARSYGAQAWRTAAVFPIVHAGYGLGLLRGLFDRDEPDEGQGPPTGPRPGAEVARASVVIRPMAMTDVPGAAALHREVFADHFLGHMGQRFLEILYEAFVGRPGAIGIVAVADGRVVGAVLGSADLAIVFSDLYRTRLLELTRAAAPRIVLDPFVRDHLATRIPHVAMAIRARFGRGSPVGPQRSDEPAAQLLSIGLAEALRGSGLAEALTETFCAHLVAAGVEGVGLSVLNDNPRAIRYYERTGWTRDRVGAISTTFRRDLRATPPRPVEGAWSTA